MERQNNEKKFKSFVRRGLNVLLGMTVLLSIALTSILYLSQTIAYEEARDVMHKAHIGMVEQIDNFFDSMEQCAYSVAYSPEILNVLKTDNSEHVLLEKTDKIRMIFSGAFVFSRYMTGIALYNSEGEYLISSGLSNSSRDKLSEKFLSIYSTTYSDTQDQGNANYWLMIYPIYSNDVLLGRKTERRGYLVFTLKWDYFQEIIRQNSYKDAVICLTDSNGHILLTNNGLMNITSKSTKYESAISHSGWILQSIQLDTYIKDEMKPLIWIASVSLAFMILIVIFMSIFFRRQIRSPLKQLDQFICKTTDLERRLDTSKVPRNELFETMTLLNNMMDELEDKNKKLLLTQTVALREEIMRQQMEIIAYRNQINPHFLYNTLDCIRGIGFAYNAPEIVTITQALSEMFRYAVKGGNWVTLEQELEHVKNFAIIIGFRFSNRITISYDIDEEILQKKVIKLFLQPIVENSVMHGLEKKIGAGHVKIEGIKQKDRMKFCIIDNGYGMTEIQIRELQNVIDHAREMTEIPGQTGIGLLNIARRLELHYHQTAYIRIQKVIDGGTKVVIDMPMKEDELSE